MKSCRKVAEQLVARPKRKRSLDTLSYWFNLRPWLVRPQSSHTRGRRSAMLFVWASQSKAFLKALLGARLQLHVNVISCCCFYFLGCLALTDSRKCKWRLSGNGNYTTFGSWEGLYFIIKNLSQIFRLLFSAQILEQLSWFWNLFCSTSVLFCSFFFFFFSFVSFSFVMSSFHPLYIALFTCSISFPPFPVNFSLSFFRHQWNSWSPQEKLDYEECDQNSSFGKLRWEQELVLGLGRKPLT